jgi:hypothetical protein
MEHLNKTTTYFLKEMMMMSGILGSCSIFYKLKGYYEDKSFTTAQNVHDREHCTFGKCKNYGCII